MKLKQLKLKNFRGYKEEIYVEFENLTAFVGKNDVGKSTILEALEIFFNNKTVQCEREDLSVNHKDEDENIEISCVFSDVDIPIILDSNFETNLKDEYLLNKDGFLEIKKVFKCSIAKPKANSYIVCCYPSEENCKDLLLLKSTELKRRAENLDIPKENYNASINASIRKAIFNNFSDLNLVETDLAVDKEDSKKIFAKLEEYFPMYALFQSDRASSDSDKEIVDPMQIAISQAIKGLEVEINKIKEEVKNKTLEIANKTLEKLKEMNSTLADSLTPEFKAEPKFDSLFKLSINSDDGIAINKRGSGVRRLILLNFFRAEAERQLKENSKKNNIIYAFEEPETSQHPNHQIMLIESFLKLSQKENCQIILTTHTPALAGMLPLDSLRLIKKEEGKTEIFSTTEETYKEITDMLGILPEPIPNTSKGILLVEGPDDIFFFNHLNKLLKEANEIEKTFLETNINILFTGGCSNLKHWITKKLVQQFNLPWAIFLDSDKKNEHEITENIKFANKISSTNNLAFYTRKREIENYLHFDLIKNNLKLDFKNLTSIGDYDDVKKLTEDKIFEKKWGKMTFEYLREKEKYIDPKDNTEHFELTEVVKKILNMIK